MSTIANLLAGITVSLLRSFVTPLSLLQYFLLFIRELLSSRKEIKALLEYMASGYRMLTNAKKVTKVSKTKLSPTSRRERYSKKEEGDEDEKSERNEKTNDTGKDEEDDEDEEEDEEDEPIGKESASILKGNVTSVGGGTSDITTTTTTTTTTSPDKLISSVKNRLDAKKQPLKLIPKDGHQSIPTGSYTTTKKRSLTRKATRKIFYALLSMIGVWMFMWLISLGYHVLIGNQIAETEANKLMADHAEFLKFCWETAAFTNKATPAKVLGNCKEALTYINNPSFNHRSVVYTYVYNHQKWLGLWTIHDAVDGLTEMCKIGFFLFIVVSVGVVVSILLFIFVYEFVNGSNTEITWIDTKQKRSNQRKEKYFSSPPSPFSSSSSSPLAQESTK